MFGYSMVQTVRTHAHKLDHLLRDQILYLHKPFTWIPCFMHKIVELTIKRIKKVSIIVQFQEDAFGEGCHSVHQLTKRHRRSSIRHTFPFVSCCSMEVTPALLEEMLTTCKHINKIYLNREVNTLLDVAVPSANARSLVRDNKELSGSDVTVAVIDTGIYPHQDLKGRIVGFVDFINQRKDAYDDNGHGTHCAGDVAGNGSASGEKYKGPAPNAKLIGIKVLDKIGTGTLESIMQGVDWCIQYNEDNPDNKIHVISMSLGSTAQKYENENKDPMVQSVEKAWEKGIVVCVAAGNEGPSAQTIASPGVSDRVITVGAYDDQNTLDRQDDDVANFSSRGPTVYGEQKPDLLAPGVNIVSLRSPNSYLDKVQKSNRVGKNYFVLSGTSMATPICAGVVAVMLENNPELTPDQVKELLTKKADRMEGMQPNNTYGYGFINAGQSTQ